MRYNHAISTDDDDGRTHWVKIVFLAQNTNMYVFKNRRNWDFFVTAGGLAVGAEGSVNNEFL